MKAILITAAALLLACGPDSFSSGAKDAGLGDSTEAETTPDGGGDAIDPPGDASDARADGAPDAAVTDTGSDACISVYAATACGNIMNAFCSALYSKCGGQTPQQCIAWWASNFPQDFDCNANKYKTQTCAGDSANKCVTMEIPGYMCGKLQSSTPSQLGGSCASFFAEFP